MDSIKEKIRIEPTLPIGMADFAMLRELKKLYAEYDVPYFMRRSQCVIRNEGGTVLGVGDLFSCVIWGEGREKGPFLTIKRV